MALISEKQNNEEPSVQPGETDIQKVLISTAYTTDLPIPIIVILREIEFWIRLNKVKCLSTFVFNSCQ